MSSQPSSRPVYQEFGFSAEPVELPIELSPSQQNLAVQASRAGRKGKTVTIISGFQTTNTALTNLLKQLKTHCGSGGTLKEQTLELQGDHKEKIAVFLRNLGYKVKVKG